MASERASGFELFHVKHSGRSGALTGRPSVQRGRDLRHHAIRPRRRRVEPFPTGGIGAESSPDAITNSAGPDTVCMLPPAKGVKIIMCR